MIPAPIQITSQVFTGALYKLNVQICQNGCCELHSTGGTVRAVGFEPGAETRVRSNIDTLWLLLNNYMQYFSETSRRQACRKKARQ
jgi:hypothetical protein